jgi:DNA-binding response OmpR family regulator
MPFTVLIIEDEPDMRVLLREMLEQRGYAVITAESGLAGLNQARSRLPDVILLDVVLGDMDGFSVCEILQRQASTARTPVILMTAMAGEMARLNGFASGAVDFLTKPLTPRELVHKVEAALAAMGPDCNAPADDHQSSSGTDASTLSRLPRSAP